MKKLQEVKVTFQNGKEISRGNVGEPKMIADSTADFLLEEAKAVPKGGLVVKSIWEEVKEPKKRSGRPKKEE